MTSPWLGPDAADTSPQPPRPAQHFRRRDMAVAAAVVAVLVTGAGAALAAGVSKDSRIRHDAALARPTATAPSTAPSTAPATHPPAPTPSSSPSAAPSAQLTDVLPGLEAFVAQKRGLPFLHEVPVDLLDDAAFKKAATGDAPTAKERAQQDGFVSTLLALGLVDSREEANQSIANGVDDVVGFYDPVQRRLAVRAGAGLTPYAQGTLVHELTHALQDQHFGLSRPDIEAANDERSIAFSALAEGDAVRVEKAWYDAQPRDVRKAYDDEESRLGGSNDGDVSVIDELSYYPYLAGPDLVSALLDSGGQARLDEAFRHPPVTTEQVFDLHSPPAVSVPSPTGSDDKGVIPPGGKVVDSGTLGELGLAVLLGEDPSNPDLAGMWRGDAYLTTDVGDAVCTRVDLVVDSAADATKLRKQLTDDYDVFTLAPDRISIRTCTDDAPTASAGTGTKT